MKFNAIVGNPPYQELQTIFFERFLKKLILVVLIKLLVQEVEHVQSVFSIVTTDPAHIFPPVYLQLIRSYFQNKKTIHIRLNL
jgi:hypothetical protein